MFNPIYTKGDVQKSLQECNLEECLELKTTLYDKYMMMVSIGKANNARQFLLMIQSIDERVGAIQLELTRQSQEKAKAKADEPEIEPSELGRPTGDRPNRWTRKSSSID